MDYLHTILAGVLAVLTLIASGSIYGDYRPYIGPGYANAIGEEYSAFHQHEWKNGKWDSYLWFYSNKNGLVFKKNVPPLNTLWYSPREKILVGLSFVKIQNNTQVIILSFEGEVLVKYSVRCMKSKFKLYGCAETVTNYTRWYYKCKPDIEVIDNKVIVNGLHKGHTKCASYCRGSSELEECNTNLDRILIPYKESLDNPELGRAKEYYFGDGEETGSTPNTEPPETTPSNEEYALEVENKIRAEHNLPQRPSYFED